MIIRSVQKDDLSIAENYFCLALAVLWLVLGSVVLWVNT
jgi:hypothetical protein